MRATLLIAAGMALLSGCANTTPFEPACPRLVAYPAETQDQAAAEIEALPPGSVLPQFIADYSVMRAEVRECAR